MASVPTAAKEQCPSWGDEVLRLQVPQTRSLEDVTYRWARRLPRPCSEGLSVTRVGEITFECLGGGLVGHFPSAARSSLRQGRGPQNERDWPRACSPALSPEGGRGGGAAWGARRLPQFWPRDEAPGEAVRVLRALAGSF